MCGITGKLGLANSHPVEESTLRQMLAMLRHRGPDQFGIYLDGPVGLGNARLSILDLDSGQQPISNEDGSLWIVFNGEIFNYVELRAELAARGHRFSTHTDTEVILHLYEELGPGCLERLNGQFAIAIWDAHRRNLFLARDRFGICPLFYSLANGNLVFASEIKALLAEGHIRAEIDPDALTQVFTFWSALSPRSIFRDILEIPPGHYLQAGHGNVTLRRYWEMDFPDWGSLPSTGAESRRIEDYVEELHDLLVDATRIRLRADVPVGAYLSGGLDSSVLASIIRHRNSNRLDTFSIAFDDPGFDESQFQRQMARHLGTQHHVLQATHADIGCLLPEVIWHTEAPLMRTSPVPMFMLSKLVRDSGYKVVLTGEGADELLGGYDIFKEAKVRRFWARQPSSTWRPLLMKRLYPDITTMAQNSSALLAAFFKDQLTNVDAPAYSHLIRWRNNRRTCRFFSEEVRQHAMQRSLEFQEQLDLPSRFSQWGFLERAQYLEISLFMSHYLLSSQGDRMMMAHSIEGRFPFLDSRVTEFCNRLPARLKLRGLTEKYLLKQVAKRWLPEAIWQRPKRPYRAPIHKSFFHGTVPPYVHDLLSPGSLRESGLFDPSVVSRLVHKIKQGMPVGETDDMALVGIISTQLVHSQFVKNFRFPRPIGGRDDIKVCQQSPLVAAV